jgi:DNA-binding transcriptional MerR regulator
MIPGRSTPHEPAGPRRRVMIADLADQLGVTTRALRHYEDVGLIQSERTSRNARAYDLKTVEVLKVIILLRQVDVPLGAIGDVISRGPDPHAQALAMREALDAALVDKKRAVARIADLIATLNIADEVDASAATTEPPRSGRFMRSEESLAAARGTR